MVRSRDMQAGILQILVTSRVSPRSMLNMTANRKEEPGNAM